jgi:hypothetical protein
MNVNLQFLWCLVIDDCVDALDIKTTRGKIGGKEIGDFSVSE